MDIELQQWGIRVVTVVPGGFTTAMAANRLRDAIRPDSIDARAQSAMDDYEVRMPGKTDLSPVVEAIVAASFDAEPKPRCLVGSGSAEMLATLVAEGERMHAHKYASERVT